MDYSSNVALCLNRAAAGSLTRKLSHLSKEKEENVQILALFNSAECYKTKDGAEVFLWNDSGNGSEQAVKKTKVKLLQKAYRFVNISSCNP